MEFATAPSAPAPEQSTEPAPLPVDNTTGLPVGLQATGVDVSALEGGNVTEATPAAGGGTAPNQPSAQEQITALATQYGFDPAEFVGVTDVATAQATINVLINRQANQGYYYNQYQQAPQYTQQPAYTPNYQQAQVQPPAPPAQDPSQGIQPLDLKGLGLNEDDPAAKAIRGLEKGFGSLYQQTQTLVKQHEEAQKQQAVQAQQQLARQIDSAIDALASPAYGTAQTRNIVQRVNVDRLNQIAASIVNGLRATGQPLPTVEAVIRRAQLIDQTNGAPGLPPQQQKQAPPPAPLAPVNPYAAPTRNVGAPPAPKAISLTERWVDNPEFRRQQGLL